MSSNNKSREHFLHLSRKIIRPEAPAKVASLPNFTSKNPTPSFFSLNIAKTDRTDRNKTRHKPASTHLRLSSGASQLKSARQLLKPTNLLHSSAEKSADRFLTSRSQNVKKERHACSIADNLSTNTILPTLSSLEEDCLERPTPHPDAHGETFMISDDGILNINPQSVVAKYINKCFKSPGILNKRKNNRTPIDFAQRMGDLTSTHHPEYIKNHGTMLSCELWGTKRRVEYRHRLEAIENKDRSFKARKVKRNSSIHDALTEINQTNNQTPSINDMIFDSKISTQSTFGTLLNLEPKTKENKGKSLAQLRRAKVKACLNDIVKASPIPPELDLEADITMEALIKEVEFPKKSSNLISPKTKVFERKNTKALFNKLRMMQQSTPKLI